MEDALRIRDWNLPGDRHSAHNVREELSAWFYLTTLLRGCRPGSVKGLLLPLNRPLNGRGFPPQPFPGQTHYLATNSVSIRLQGQRDTPLQTLLAFERDRGCSAPRGRDRSTIFSRPYRGTSLLSKPFKPVAPPRLMTITEGAVAKLLLVPCSA